MAMRSVIRTLQSLKEDGVLEEEASEIIILKRNKLKQISENGEGILLLYK